jgi:hypothetical protein
MTDDFSKPFRGVAWFGIWATDTADDYGRREALLVLAGAIDMCMDDDMRNNPEVGRALSYLARTGHEKRARAFRRALDVHHPQERRKAAADALHAMQDGVALSWGETPARL